jgi:hypothetical protein
MDPDATSPTLPIICVFLAALAHAADPPDETADPARAPMPPLVRAAYTDQAPHVDGSLSDAAWGRVKDEDGILSLRRPGGTRSRLATECSFLYDTKNLYLAARCREPRMDRVRAEAAQEAEALLDDYVAFCFDVEGDGRSYLMFAVNPSGVGADLHAVAGPGEGLQKDLGYSSGWKAAAKREGEAWTVEASIPLAMLRLASPPAAELGFEVIRKSRHAEETSRWRHPTDAVVRPSDFGRLAVGNAPAAMRLQNVAPAPPDTAVLTLDLRNPSWRDQEAAVSVRLQSASRATVTREECSLEPGQARTLRVPVVYVDPAMELTVEASQSDPPRPIHRQRIRFEAAGMRAWLPEAVCRQGRSGLPLRVWVPAAADGRQTVDVAVTVLGEGEAKTGVELRLKAAPAQVAEAAIDPRTLKPGDYTVRCAAVGQGVTAAAAECSLRVVPASVRPGAEWTWEPDIQPEPSVPAGAKP